MSREDYVAFADIVGKTLAIADEHGCRTEVYESLYVAVSDHLKAENPAFDRLRFAFAVSQAELPTP